MPYNRYNSYGNYKSYNYTPKPKEPSAAEKYKNYEYGTIAVTVAPGKIDLRTKQPLKNINLYNVDAESAREIVERLNDKTKSRATRSAAIDPKESTHIIISIFPQDVDTWLDSGDLNAVQSVLLKSGKYNNDEVMHLEDEIATGFYSSNKEVINKAHNEAGENSMEMWQKYLSTIKDPVTLEQIKLYSRVYGNVSYGHLLSTKNASLIKAYDKDATFVLAPGQWKKLFGRGIKRNAKPLPLYVWVPKGEATLKDIEDAKNTSGWEDASDDELSTQVKNDIRMKANKTGGLTIRKIGYDVRDTYLLSGVKEDKWTSEIGLLNNLNGELNKAALNDKVQRNTSRNTEIDGNTEMEKRTEKACAWMENFCLQNGYEFDTRAQDVNNKLADMLLSYCTKNATKKANILKESNIRVYAENATQITLILTRLAWPALNRFHSTYEYTKKEATALMNVVFKIAFELEKNSVITEGVFSWLKNKVAFVKAFFKALRQIGCSVKENEIPVQGNLNNQETPKTETPEDESRNYIKNTFNEVFDRINKNFFYDDRKKI